MIVVGVSVTAGVLSLVALDSPSSEGSLASPVAGSASRIERNTGLDEAHQLVDMTHRIETYLSARQPKRVALARTRKFSALTYADAYARVTAVCALMAACVACKVAFAEVSTESIASRMGGGVQAKSLQDIAPSLFGYETPPTYWRTGVALAHGAGTTQIPAPDTGEDA